jgi:hypothetical protein
MRRGVRVSSSQGALFEDRAPADVLESVIQKQIKDYCRARNVICFRTNSGKVKTPSGHWIELCPKGTPDLYTLFRGYSVWIETKRPGEQPTPEQLLMHDELRRNGAFVVVADNLMQVQRYYYELNRKIERGELPKIV